MICLLAAAFSLLIASSIAYHGVDVSQLTSASSFSCLKSNGYSFAIVRVYCSSGKTDSNGPASINNAWSGGMNYVDGYIFPCYSCGNPEKQMDDTISYLASHDIKPRYLNGTKNEEANLGASYGMLWIDVEGTSYWSSSTSNNVDFIKRMAAEGKSRGLSIGIYTSNSQWSPITGGSTALSSYPLWYPHYDNKDSFSDFSPFGGWSKPAIKQYIGTTSICSASVDKNYY
eukprot:gene10203-13727_t